MLAIFYYTINGELLSKTMVSHERDPITALTVSQGLEFVFYNHVVITGHKSGTINVFQIKFDLDEDGLRVMETINVRHELTEPITCLLCDHKTNTLNISTKDSVYRFTEV